MNHFQDQRVAKEINLKDLFRVIKKRFWIVIVFAVLATAAGWFYSNANKTVPLYETSTNIIINAETGYRNTLQVIIKDTIVLEKVIRELELERSPSSLAGSINVGSIDDTQVVKITVTDTNPTRAADIANTTAKVFIEEIPNIMGFEDVRVLSEAKINLIPINEDNQNKIIIAAFIFGIIAGIGLIFLIDSLDDSIKSEKDIESVLGIQVLGSVSKINKKNVNKRKNRQTKLEFRGETIGFK
ncbi:capsular polysaccharide biosynthesis protein [Cytobacillus firmus]|uniref:Capsular polysaccharide biosynthesis protein n=2 Tax=Cytobacillus TaxID=2675230 RepID=A0A366JL22_CYTFI|nr:MULTISPECIES: Wzz/FepE/Etk N-terminal domain-containing protein [Cytobacillus]RBP88289.1 capsular polysaccharide biosynthesis protein [Cytobacillus firmus]TDX38362.1 capsular polysaccharide biosynthesis protein [Cytobacillus oceanisediminis]